MRRHYINAAPTLTLNSGITSAATSLTVSGSFAGWPTSTPYFGVLEYGTANMEIVLVTAVVGSTATITRAQDGTVAVSHLAGATLDHAVVAKDVDEANAHVNGNSGVHGVTGNVVGDTDVQTLSNKTLASPTLTGTVSGGALAPASVAATGAVSGSSVAASGAVTGASVAATGAVSGASVAGLLKPTVYANAAARDAAVTSPSAGTVVYLTTPGVLSVYNGTVWQTVSSPNDTGWLTTGMTAGQAGVTISSQRYRVIGNRAYIFANGTLGSTLAAYLNTNNGGGSGDNPNQAVVANIPSAAVPVQSQPLSTGLFGPIFAFTVDSTGTVSITASPSGAGSAYTLSATSAWSFGGMYLLD